MKTIGILAGVTILAAVAVIPLMTQAQGMWGPSQATGPVTLDQAVALANQAIAEFGNRDLAPVEIMEFTRNFYVAVAEKSTGVGAFELIVERSGFVHPEPGPNMMWNTKYGHMAGWGGRGMMYGPGYTGQQLSRDQARQIIQAWLDRNFPGTKADEGMPFYGYFTFDFERTGEPAGMASVSAFTGQIWYHTWHGTFVREKGLE